ncbi:tyrosine-sulfated glycopeptide receptor 1 [Olea europaea subsp. europaea]|uniref:Tyrosine-sulfated glycopeptide receptor 1 n=1 Tax=Olea europaea subsp. europaea TaxID=158383 RepID=A0A8S0TBY0_OLEEU|nr:tyrosine-sulfated glycopeptide receptor 1 [Olea europaea subsp. europaea]
MWEGVSCDNDDRVIHLLLPSRGLVGSISPSVANLSHLSQFNLSQNRLSGPIPDGFFMAFKRLVVVDLSENRLTGKLSDFDKLMSTVKTVNLSSNDFQGTIQYAFVQQAVNLKSFDVSNNSFSGQFLLLSVKFLPQSSILISHEISFVVQFPKFLGAGFNNLSGDVPSDIYIVSSLQELYLSANSLSGPINGSLVNLINLRTLSLYDNRLTGTIPQDIGRLSNLENLFLQKNLLNGTLPPSLANCTRLVKLDLSFNFLEGELSAFDFSKFIQLRSVDLVNNSFSGGLPASLYSCNKLTAIRLANNKLNGEISPGIMGLPSLSFLSLSSNCLNNITSAIQILSGCKNLRILLLSLNFFDESLPDDDSLIGSDGFQNLQVLALNGCRLTGQIPMWISRLSKLEVLDLSRNNITGPIPYWFGDLPNLFQLQLHRNLLSGQFPVELTGLRRLTTKRSADQVDQSFLEFPIFFEPNNAYNLEYNKLSNLPPEISIQSNSISGTIPTEIGQLKFITALDLSNNNFSGSIPDTISNLTNLEELDISSNHLSGQIPASFKNLHFLSRFNVAYNNLDGPIPVGGQFETFPNSSFEGNPGLCCEFFPRSCSGQSETTLQKGTKRKIFNWLSFGIGYGISFNLGVQAGLKFL